jgi:hypothetical protein
MTRFMETICGKKTLSNHARMLSHWHGSAGKQTSLLRKCARLCAGLSGIVGRAFLAGHNFRWLDKLCVSQIRGAGERAPVIYSLIGSAKLGGDLTLKPICWGC